jgi:hypothetical protein
MSRTTKTLLALAITGLASGLFFVSGLIDVKLPALYVALPAGAIFFGLFLISRMLEKEVSAFDKEQQSHAILEPGPTATREASSHSAHPKLASSKA